MSDKQNVLKKTKNNVSRYLQGRFATRQTWLFSSTSTYHSTDLLTARGVAHLVVHGTTGSTSYETIPPFVRLESCGGVDMVVQRRDGPRRLREHDDDDDDDDFATRRG